MLTAAVTSPEGSVYSRVSARGVDLPAPLDTYLASTGYSVSPRACHFSVPPSQSRPTASSIAVASRLRLRSRLTLIRLALIRKPWSYGGRVSRPPYRYLCLHLLFNTLQHASRRTFSAYRMLPYQSRISVIPRLRYRAYARLLSTRDRSTSELLRTL